MLALCQARTPSLRSHAADSNSSSHSLRVRSQRPGLRAAAGRRRRLGTCRATAEKEGTQQQQGQDQVPSTPPSPTGSAQERLPAADASSQQGEPVASIEDIQQRAAMMRQQKQAAQAKDGLVQGVVEEVGLIKWPAPGKAVLNTLLVILIVAGTAGLLLGINTLLTELSNAVY